MNKPIRILLVEDQSMVLGALAALLGLEPDIEIVATAGDGRQARDLVRDTRPDVVLTDIEMPHVTGIELAEHIQREHGDVRTIVLTTFARAGYLRRALDAGVTGYLLKDAPSEELAIAIRKVAAGQRAIDPQLALQSLDSRDPLTDRERQALRLAAEGKTTTQISAALFLSEGTVRNYLSEAIGKLNATNRIEAARIARLKGWL